MPGRRLGPLQHLVLVALYRHGRATSLRALAALAAGLIPALGAPLLPDRSPSRAQYVSVSRAVAALKQRGLVETELVGVERCRFEWRAGCGGRLHATRKTHRTTCLLVRAVPNDYSPEKWHELEVRD